MTGSKSSGATSRPVVALMDDEKIVITVMCDPVACGDGRLAVDEARRLIVGRFAARV